MTGGKTLDLVLKEMLELFLKTFTFSKKYKKFNTEKKTAKLIRKGKLQTKNQNNEWKIARWTLWIIKQTSKKKN